jgi:hypothetical protein
MRRHGGDLWIASSPADVPPLAGFMPSRLGYDTVSKGRGEITLNNTYSLFRRW